MDTRSPRPFFAVALAALLLALAYAASGLLGMQLAAPPGNVTPVWLPAGLSLAALLTFGRRVWPGITLGSFVTNLLVFPGEGVPRIVGSLAIALCSTVGLVLIHWLSTRKPRPHLLRRPSALMAFGGWVALGCMVNATGGLLFTALLSPVPASEYVPFWLTWWLGDSVGVLLLAPLALREATPIEPRPLEWLATLVLTLAASQVAFGTPLLQLGSSPLPLVWAISLGVVWAGARLGAAAVSVHTVLIYALMSWGTLAGQGPFASWPRPLAMMLADALLVVVIVTGQLLASLAALTRAQRAELERERLSLEARVIERTAQLEASSRSLLEETKVRGELTARLVDAQKQEALGKLAGGVAHDFNNLLTVVSGEAELIRHQKGHRPDVYDSAGAILAAAHRAGELTRQLLAVARRQPTAPRHVELQSTLATNRRLLRPLFPESVTLDVACPGPIGVNIDPTLLDQIILNLAINARDAITGGRGTVTLEAAAHRLDQAAALELGLREGKWVSLAVTDDGAGIPPEVLPRIFEPFFTTKAEGRGTGLGLSTVLGIANQSKGTVKVSSREGQTRFTVWLPASEGAVESRPATPVRGAVAPATILVVEDEPLVRRTVVLALERAGHRVLTAGDGEEGLALLRQPGHGVQLVLTDVIMPRLGGVELARALRAGRAAGEAALPVLFMSGFHERQVELESEHVLGKPFTADQLLASVELMLRAVQPDRLRAPSSALDHERDAFAAADAK